MTHPSSGPARGVGASPRTPRWAKVLGVLLVLLVVLIAVLHVTGNSLGGPGDHLGLAAAAPVHGPAAAPW
jgi:hypothetical protein